MPDGTSSLALTCQDPDAPRGTEIGLPEGATIVQVRDALRDVTLAAAQLLGTYER